MNSGRVSSPEEARMATRTIRSLSSSASLHLASIFGSMPGMRKKGSAMILQPLPSRANSNRPVTDRQRQDTAIFSPPCEKSPSCRSQAASGQPRQSQDDHPANQKQDQEN